MLPRGGEGYVGFLETEESQKKDKNQFFARKGKFPRRQKRGKRARNKPNAEFGGGNQKNRRRQEKGNFTAGGKRGKELLGKPWEKSVILPQRQLKW